MDNLARISMFCPCRMFSRPRPFAPEFDSALCEHICDKIHAITLDAASNEVAAAKDVMSASAGACIEGAPQGHMPNLKIRSRDRAHGMRRVLQRPWEADVYHDALITSLVLGAGSISQLVQHSITFQTWFADCCAMVDKRLVSTVYHDLRAAKHRY